MAQGQIGSGMIGIGVSGVEPKQASGLANDISNLFGSVAKGVETYNTIGETAAKLQASEDITEFKSQVATLKSSLAYADKKPEIYLEVQNRIDELGAEMVAKSEKLANHKAAYDVYKGYASEAYSDVASNYEPTAQIGYMKESLAKKTYETKSKADIAGLMPSNIELEASKLQGSVLGQSVLEAEDEVTASHLNAIDTELKGLNPALLFQAITTNKEVDAQKVVNLLNTKSGSLVEYTINPKTKTVELKTNVESQSIKEQYMARYSSLVGLFSKKGGDEPNLDYKAWSQNHEKSPLGNTLEDIYVTYKKNKEASDKYEQSYGFQIQTPAEDASHVGGKKDNYNMVAEGEAIKGALVNGNNPLGATYASQEVVVAEGGKYALAPTKERATVNVAKVGTMISGYANEINKSISNGNKIDFNMVSAIGKYDKSYTAGFQDAFDASMLTGTKVGDMESTQNRLDMLQYLSLPSSGASGAERAIYNESFQEASLIQKKMVDYKNSHKDSPQTEKVLADFAERINATVLNVVPDRASSKQITAYRVKNIVDTVGIDLNGLMTNPDVVDMDTVIEVTAMLSSEGNNPNPSDENVARVISDRGANLSVIFGWNKGLSDQLIIRPKNKDGGIISENHLRDGLKSYFRDRNLKASDYKIENGSLVGNNNTILIRNKNNNTITDSLSGTWFDLQATADMNRAPAKTAERHELPATIVKQTLERQKKRNKVK